MKKVIFVVLMVFSLVLLGCSKKEVSTDSQTSQPPIPVSEILKNPESYIGKEVVVRGSLRSHIAQCYRSSGPSCGCFWLSDGIVFPVRNIFLTFNDEVTCGNQGLYGKYLRILPNYTYDEEHKEIPLENYSMFLDIVSIKGTIKHGVKSFDSGKKEQIYLDINISKSPPVKQNLWLRDKTTDINVCGKIPEGSSMKLGNYYYSRDNCFQKIAVFYGDIELCEEVSVYNREKCSGDVRTRLESAKK